jgi:hypothetical protein
MGSSGPLHASAVLLLCKEYSVATVHGGPTAGLHTLGKGNVLSSPMKRGGPTAGLHTLGKGTVLSSPVKRGGHTAGLHSLGKGTVLSSPVKEPRFLERSAGAVVTISTELSRLCVKEILPNICIILYLSVLHACSGSDALFSCVASLSKCYVRQCEHNEPFQAVVVVKFC